MINLGSIPCNKCGPWAHQEWSLSIARNKPWEFLGVIQISPAYKNKLIWPGARNLVYDWLTWVTLSSISPTCSISITLVAPVKETKRENRPREIAQVSRKGEKQIPTRRCMFPETAKVLPELSVQRGRWTFSPMPHRPAVLWESSQREVQVLSFSPPINHPQY